MVEACAYVFQPYAIVAYTFLGVVSVGEVARERVDSVAVNVMDFCMKA
jgi:hypothetical protein